MAYSKENFVKVREMFDEKAKSARKAAEIRTQQLHAAHPELAEIDRALSRTGLAVFAQAMKGKEGLDARLAKLRKENEELQASRAQCLEYYGYPADYTDPHYECPICSDTGTVGDRMCTCFKRALVLATYESSGIGSLLKTQSFGNFDLDFYPRGAARTSAQNALDVCRDYASRFPDVHPLSLTLQGATGLGKTHLSTSMAREIIDCGYDVVYEPAQSLFYAMEERHFGHRTEGNTDPTERYYSCDLLIIDDLGAEMTTAFTVSALYALINTRTTAGKATVINTNVTPDECRRRYGDRITSRLFGEFTYLPLLGTDIRMQKLKNQSAQ